MKQEHRKGKFEKRNKTKSSFFEKINKYGNPLARSRKKKDRTQMTKTKNERKDITTNLAEIKRILEECYEQLYANKLDEMNKFLETYSYQN